MAPIGIYLILNAGSSSIKFAGYQADSLDKLFVGQLDDQRKADQVAFSVTLKNSPPKRAAIRVDQGGERLSLKPIFDWLANEGPDASLRGIGHRVVHGGDKFQQPVVVNDDVLAAIQACNQFAPLHNPSNLKGIRDCRQRFADVPQVAVFDTAFHQTLPAENFLYPLPYNLYKEMGVRRYGFHGTSHEYVASAGAKLIGKAPEQLNAISLHLGNGCSAAAIAAGKSIDTTMGMTPLEGMMMGTRCGDIDPGLAQFLCHQLDKSIDEITDLFNKQSGLLGVSELSSDMRALQQAASQGNAQAELAIDMFCLRAAKAVAAMRVSLPALDTIIFTGGIGEHSPLVRSKILAHLAWLGIELDEAANACHGENTQGLISQATVNAEAPGVLVVPTDEELMIARHVRSQLTQMDKESSA